jgi:apolipoprotein N-acyltransferase
MKNSKRLWQASLLLLSLSGGILMGLTPAPVEAWSLAWIALVPLWFLVNRGGIHVVPTSLKQSALYGLFWGIGYHGLAVFWITGIHPMTWMGVPWLASLAIAVLCWTFITLWGGILVAVWAAVMFWLIGRTSGALPAQPGFWIDRKAKILPLVRVLIGTALWCSLEALWSAIPLWWTSLSYTQSPHNLLILHLGQLSGPSTVTAAIVAVNGLIAEAWISYEQTREHGRERAREKRNRDIPYQYSGKLATPSLPHPLTYLGIALGLLVALHLIGFGLYHRPLIPSPEAALKVGIIQGNIGNDVKLFTEGKRRALERYTKGYQNLANQGIDAVLTPETALPFYLIDLKHQDFYSAILEKGIVAWVGAYGERGPSYTNSLFTLTGTGDTFSRYDKVNLVPLGEYIPFESVIGKIIDRLSPLDAHLAAGKPNQVFETPFGRAIVGICYDSAFAKHFQRQTAAGGQFIITASNNAHYSPAMPAQHHAQDVMRAIESDRWAIRATNTGYSGIVDPHGRTLWISGINTYEIHADTVYRRQTQTLYVRWGDWLTPLLLVGAGLSWFVFNRR